MNWFILSLKKIFTFKGRARRKEYGWFMLIYLLINIVLGILEGAAEALNQQTLNGFILLVNFVVGLYLWLASLSLTARRLHDLGYSGWWQLAPLGGLILIIFIAMLAGDTGTIALIIVVAIAYLIYSLWLLFKEGQRFENKYGADPKAISTETDMSDFSEKEQHKDKIIQKF